MPDYLHWPTYTKGAYGANGWGCVDKENERERGRKIWMFYKTALGERSWLAAALFG